MDLHYIPGYSPKIPEIGNVNVRGVCFGAPDCKHENRGQSWPCAGWEAITSIFRYLVSISYLIHVIEHIEQWHPSCICEHMWYAQQGRWPVYSSPILSYERSLLRRVIWSWWWGLVWARWGSRGWTFARDLSDRPQHMLWLNTTNFGV